MIATVRTGSLLCLAMLALGLPGTAFAEGAASKSSGPPPLPPQELRILDSEGHAPSEVSKKPSTEVESYCLNIADQAQDARYAIQEKQLKKLEGQITARIDELEARREDYKKWLEERRAFLEGASSIVVDIYASMKSDAAAAQLSKLNKNDTAAILVQLKSRQASAILSEMDPKVAADVAQMIVNKTSNGGVDGKKIAENQS